MTAWKRHLDCNVEIKDYFDLISSNIILCSVFLNANDEWCLLHNGFIDVCDSRLEGFDFAEGRFSCEGIKRIRNRRK